MNRLNWRRIALSCAVLTLFASSLSASTITPQIGGGIGQFDGGISSGGGSGPPFDIFLDSVNGLNTNSGLTSSAPKQTVAAAQPLISTSKKRIGSACGSHWREQLTISVNNPTVGSYSNVTPCTGTALNGGNLPIFDASDIIPAGNWTLASGATNTYMATVTFAAGGTSTTWANIFETGGPGDSATGQFLSFQSGYAGTGNLTNAGSYFVTGMSAGSGIPSGAIVVYVRATDSSNPASNGYVYETSSRSAGLNVVGVGATVSGIETRKNAGNDGAMIFEGGPGTYNVTNIIARDGGKHVFLSSGGTTLSNSLFINSYYSSNSGGLAVIHDATGSGLGATVTGNIFQQDQLVDSGNTTAALISHSDNAGSLGTISVTGTNWCIAKNNANMSCVSLQDAVANIDSLFGSQIQSFIDFFGNTTVTNSQAVTSFAANQILQFGATGIITMSGNKWAFGNTSNGSFYWGGAANWTINVTNDINYLLSAGGNNGIYELFSGVGSSTITVNGSIFDGVNGRGTIMPIQNFGSGVTYTGGNLSPNCFNAANNVNSWEQNAVSFGSLAAWQAASNDTNATTSCSGASANTLPAIPVVN